MIDSYYNGKLGSFCDMRIPLTDRAIWFGDGIYDAAISRNQKIYMLQEHLERFVGNAKRMDIPLYCSPAELKEILIGLASSSDDCKFLYFQLTRFSERRSHSYADTERSNLLITASDIHLPSPDATLNLICLNDIRYRLCDVKTLNLIPAVLASRAAADKGADEAILLRDGTVTECAHSNVSIIKRGELLTHPTDETILPGTTRSALIRIARAHGIPVREKPFGYEELISADEVLITSTSKLCQRAKTIDQTEFDTTGVGLGLMLCKAMFQEFFRCTSQ